MQIFFVITDRRSQIGGTGTTPLLHKTQCLLASREPGGSADGGGLVVSGVRPLMDVPVTSGGTPTPPLVASVHTPPPPPPPPPVRAELRSADPESIVHRGSLPPAEQTPGKEVHRNCRLWCSLFKYRITCNEGCGDGAGVARSRGNDAGFIMGIGVGVGVGTDQTRDNDKE